MRLHVVGLPHTNHTPAYSWCAYTQKVVKFAKMMTDVGVEVVTYGNGPAEIAGKYVQVDDTTYKDFFVPPFEPTDWVFSHFNDLATAHVFDHITQGDIVCIIGGTAQAPIGHALSHYPVVEFGIGYSGTFAKYKVWESYPWMHHVLGMRYSNGWVDADRFDTVIPNYFDAKDFSISRDKPYYAFMGRICRAKGVDIAITACKEAGVPLKIAGRIEEENSDCKWVEGLHGDIEYVGSLGLKQRKAFLSHAKAVLCPTRYSEPFCGVHIEAMFSGAPVIAPDWGAFTETITNGVNGWRCRSDGDYVNAIGETAQMSPGQLRSWATRHYSLDAIAPKYLDYFEKVLDDQSPFRDR